MAVAPEAVASASLTCGEAAAVCGAGRAGGGSCWLGALPRRVQ